MGLAASQARLLTLTSRAIDLEMKCLTLSAATLRNAQESYNLSVEHNEALDQLDLSSKDPNSEFYIGQKITSMTVNGAGVNIGDGKLSPDAIENITPFNVDYVVNNSGGSIEHSKYIKDGQSTRSTRTETEVQADIKNETETLNNNKSNLTASDNKLTDLKDKSAAWEAGHRKVTPEEENKNAELRGKIDTLNDEKAQYVTAKEAAEGDIKTQDDIITTLSAEASKQYTEALRQDGIAAENKTNYGNAQKSVEALKELLSRPNGDTYGNRQAYESALKAAGQYSAAWHEAEAKAQAARNAQEAANQKVEAAKTAKTEAEARRNTADSNISRIDGEIAALESQIVPEPTVTEGTEDEVNPYPAQIATEESTNSMYKMLVSNSENKLKELNSELAQIKQPYTSDEQKLMEDIKKSPAKFLEALKAGTISIVGPDGKVVDYEDMKRSYNKDNFLPEDDMDSTQPNISYTTGKDKDAYDQEKSRIDRHYDDEEKKLSLKDKKIQMEQQQVQTELNAVNTERDSVKSLIEKNVEKSFTYGYNA